jgi:hypothetical protein
MVVLIPVYWYHYGPTNFLYFCDIALLLTLVGMWLDKPLLISLPAVGILLPQALWCVDFVVQLCGFTMTGMTSYMFDETKPLFLRGLSLFHGWLPFLLLFLPKAGATLADPNLPRNVNYVFGMDDAQSQTWMSAELYLVTWMALLIILVYLPTHFLLKKICPTPAQAAAKRA